MSCSEGKLLVNKIYFLVLPKNFRKKFRDSGCHGVGMATWPGCKAHMVVKPIGLYNCLDHKCCTTEKGAFLIHRRVSISSLVAFV